MSSISKAGILAIGMAAAVPALAGHDRDGRDYRNYVQPEYEYAQVVDVDPLMREVRVVVPRQECFTETRYVPVGGRGGVERPAAAQMIVGGLIGAVIGHQIGHRRDTRQAGTIAGAVIGSAIGHDAAQRRAGLDPRGEEQLQPIESQRCEVREEEHFEQQVDGYRVTYRYHGRLYTTQLPYEPGPRIRIRVNVEPVA